MTTTQQILTWHRNTPTDKPRRGMMCLIRNTTGRTLPALYVYQAPPVPHNFAGYWREQVDNEFHLMDSIVGEWAEIEKAMGNPFQQR